MANVLTATSIVYPNDRYRLFTLHLTLCYHILKSQFRETSFEETFDIKGLIFTAKVQEMYIQDKLDSQYK